MNERVEVSVYCLAYNHENYIRDALDGFVKQKTNFRYEVVVHDDASIDCTAGIIKEYAEKYPDIIKPIFQKENQYSQKVNIPQKFLFPQMKGRYFAMCEGDDFWTDEYKLQKQYDALEKHPECDMCAHNAHFFDCSSQKILREFPAISENRILSAEEVIYGEGGFLPTASLFYRRSVRINPMEFQKFWDIDYTIQIRGALSGGIVFLSDSMSLYRWQVPGSWTDRNKSIKIQKSLFEKKQKMLSILNKETCYKYDEIIKKRMQKNSFNLNITQDNYKEVLKRDNRELFYEMRLVERIKVYIKHYCPIILKIQRMLKSQ